LIQKEFKDTLGLNWKAEYWRIRCLGHIINLIVQAFLFTNLVNLESLESYNKQEEIRAFNMTEALRS
jgi:hypothetical protein